jgi:hypothetical protein
VTTFYNFSGGMESAAMLVLDRDRIRDTGAIVRWADTGKHFPEMAASIEQIEAALGLKIVTVPRRIDFDTYLFERGGMIRKGTNDCSRKMKRSNLSRHAKTFPKPWEINLGFNAGETDRADAFSDRNERDWCHWRYPLIEHRIKRDDTWEICRKAGFSILVSMYEKMGRFDCYMCGNQTPVQARLVVQHYPDLADDWKDMEQRKGHSFMRTPLALIEKDMNDPGLFAGCSCFGGTDDVFQDDEEEESTRE